MRKNKFFVFLSLLFPILTYVPSCDESALYGTENQNENNNYSDDTFEDDGIEIYEPSQSTNSDNYIVTFVIEETDEIYKVEVPKKSASKTTIKYPHKTPVYDPEDPKFEYIFDHWEPDLKKTKINKDTTFVAKFRLAIKTYKITFLDDSENIYFEQNFEYETLPECPTNPVKSSDNEYAYDFSHWEPTIVPVTEEATYTAVFTPVPPFTVNFYSAPKGSSSNSILYTNHIIRGKKAKYDSNKPTPTKASTDTYVYTFSHWEPDLETTSIYKDTDFYPVFTQTRPEYTITFNTGDKTTTQTVKRGDTPSYSSTPTKSKDSNNYCYTFKGWDKSFAKASKNDTYTAQFYKDYQGFIFPSGNSRNSYSWSTAKTSNFVTISESKLTKINVDNAKNSLSAIVIDPSITEIGAKCLDGQKGIASISIPHSVKTLVTNSLTNCQNLSTVFIPVSVTKIESGVLSKTVNIKYRGSESQWNKISIYDDKVKSSSKSFNVDVSSYH